MKFSRIFLVEITPWWSACFEIILFDFFSADLGQSERQSWQMHFSYSQTWHFIFLRTRSLGRAAFCGNNTEVYFITLPSSLDGPIFISHWPAPTPARVLGILITFPVLWPKVASTFNILLVKAISNVNCFRFICLC